MLPTRNGVGPSCVALPPGNWPLMLDFLAQRFPHIGAQEWVARMHRQEVVDGHGNSVCASTPYRAPGRLFYYRDVHNERVNPAQETVLFQDDLLVVADKPHGLPVTPSGQHLQETLLVRLRKRLGIDALTPLHRIDQDTAGLMLFAKRPDTVAPYAALFARRAISKTYEAIAPHRPDMHFPVERKSVLLADTHFMQVREWRASDPPAHRAAAHTHVELLETSGTLARYRLTPHSGQRHQLRVHMCALGLPIVGDRIYPVLQPQGSADPAQPLQLLAQRIAFTDPLTGTAREFRSERSLQWASAMDERA